MKKVIVFGGTTEGRILAESLANGGIACIYCVATEYGKQAVKESEFIQVRTGRMDWRGMSKLIADLKPDAIVDATHPFAEIVKKELENAIFNYGDVPFFRVTRDEDNIDYSNCTFFDNAVDCANELKKTNGKIFLTTGSKELPVFCEDPELRERIIARVIPSQESISICSQNGLKGNQIIAMQGPFSAGMNLAFLRESQAKILVLKEGGKASGEAERIIAANKAAIKCFVIRRPNKKDEGYSLSQVKEKLFEELGITEKLAARQADNSSKLVLTIAGFGMGFGSITADVEQAILEADYIFASPRLLATIETDSKKYPYYLAKDIIAKLDELNMDIKFGQKRALILFSGDTGFYSGATKFKKELEEKTNYKPSVLPGISSISALSAKLGQTWQDARLISTHGIDNSLWLPKLIDFVSHNEKVFLLTSGSKDIRIIGQTLSELEGDGARSFDIYVGTNLYADEAIVKLTSEQCAAFNEDGLSTILIKNNKASNKLLVPGISDSNFLRDKVPMSKEEIRAVSLCKLQITSNSICYDIGSGTGSVAVEMGLLDSSIRVYAVELKEQACALIEKNIKKFNLKNVSLICGTAPEILEGLPAPSHVFIGGSGGRLDEIIKRLQAFNQPIRIVINAVTIETISEIMRVLKKYQFSNVDVVQLSVSKAKQAGEYNILQGQNPVFIVSFNLGL